MGHTESVRLGTPAELQEALKLRSVESAWRIGRGDLIPGATVRVGKRMRFRMDVVERWVLAGGSLAESGNARPAHEPRPAV